MLSWGSGEESSANGQLGHGNTELVIIIDTPVSLAHMFLGCVCIVCKNQNTCIFHIERHKHFNSRTYLLVLLLEPTNMAIFYSPH